MTSEPGQDAATDAADAELAASLAHGAGLVLLGLREADEVSGADGDRSANEYLLAQLAAARPQDAVLSEEAKDDPARLGAERVWIVDPLDGTREYAERTDGAWRTDFAVHVACGSAGRGWSPVRWHCPHAARCSPPTLPRRCRRCGPKARSAWQ